MMIQGVTHELGNNGVGVNNLNNFFVCLLPFFARFGFVTGTDRYYFVKRGRRLVNWREILCTYLFLECFAKGGKLTHFHRYWRKTIHYKWSTILMFKKV